jgi:restriction system protein
MTKTSEEEKILLGNDLTLEQWLELMEKRPKNVLFQHFQFPTDTIKEQFLSSISNYSEKTVTKILNSFLLPTGSLGSDLHEIKHFKELLKSNPEEAKRLIKKGPYWHRVAIHLASSGDIPLREGITWITDLLPFSPREALDALHAYLHAHIATLPDGRIYGLSDAMAILRARYFNTDNQVFDSVLNSLKPIDLEHLAESLYHAMGFITAMTKPSHDGGRDIIATKDEPGKKERNLIQCKKWQDVVGVDEVRALLGVVSYEKATKGTLITTSHFSPAAKKLASTESRIELISRKPLQQILSEYHGKFWVTNTDYLISDSMRRHPLNKRK